MGDPDEERPDILDSRTPIDPPPRHHPQRRLRRLRSFRHLLSTFRGITGYTGVVILTTAFIIALLNGAMLMFYSRALDRCADASGSDVMNPARCTEFAQTFQWSAFLSTVVVMMMIVLAALLYINWLVDARQERGSLKGFRLNDSQRHSQNRIITAAIILTICVAPLQLVVLLPLESIGLIDTIINWMTSPFG